MSNDPSLEMFFLASAIIGGILFFVRLIMFFLGAGDGADLADELDTSFDAGDSEGGFKFISFQGVAGFFLMFGLVGLAILSGGASSLAALGGAAGSGLVTLFIVALLFNSIRKLQSDGTLRLENAIGKEGTVYLTIPAEGSGQVRVAVQGGLKIFDAISTNQERIPTGENVRVVKVVSGNVLVVERADHA